MFERTEGRVSSERPIRPARVDRAQLRKFNLAPEDATKYFVVHHRLHHTAVRVITHTEFRRAALRTTASEPRTIRSCRNSRSDAQDSTIAILIQTDFREITKGPKAHDSWLLIHARSRVKKTLRREGSKII